MMSAWILGSQLRSRVVPSWMRTPSGVLAWTGSEASMTRVMSVAGLFVVPGWVLIARRMSSVSASAKSCGRVGMM